MADMTGITVRTTASGVKRYRAQAWDNDAGRNAYRTFPTPTAARNWRRDMETKIRNGTGGASEPVTVGEAFSAWLAAAEAGTARTRSGEPYKPGVLISYKQTYDVRLGKAFGRTKVGELRRGAIQRYVDKLVAAGLAAQTIKNSVNTLRVLLRWCVRQGWIAANPCDDVELPSGGQTRDRIASPSEALDLVQALPDKRDRAVMATAFFAGLRRGELMALRWEDVDLEARTLTVHHERGNYDPKSKQFVAPKSKKGARLVGLPKLLVPFLAALDWTEGLVFSGTEQPFSERMLRKRALRAWMDATLEPITLHEARHTYASLMIAAGVNIKAISEWMGHSSVTITLDRYGHLLPGSTAVALGLLDDYLEHEIHVKLNKELS